MLIFKSLEDVAKARLPSRLDGLVRRSVEEAIRAGDFPEEGHPYDPEADGYVVLLQPGDDRRRLTELGLENPVDGLTFESLQVDPHSRAFVGCFLANNQFALTIILPDASWLHGGVRQRMTDKLDPLPEQEGKSYT